MAAGEPIGTLTVTSGGEAVAELPLLAGEEVPRITFGQMLLRVLQDGVSLRLTACPAGQPLLLRQMRPRRSSCLQASSLVSGQDG